VEQLGKLSIVNKRGMTWRRRVMEKPMGHDLEAARGL
jgi:glucose-6-phosphate 1-dehydrogenase